MKRIKRPGPGHRRPLAITNPLTLEAPSWRIILCDLGIVSMMGEVDEAAYELVAPIVQFPEALWERVP